VASSSVFGVGTAAGIPPTAATTLNFFAIAAVAVRVLHYTVLLGIGLAGWHRQGAAVNSLLVPGVWQTELATSVGIAGLIALCRLFARMMGLALKGRPGTASLLIGALLASASLA
jgi:hypothetical protein